MNYHQLVKYVVEDDLKWSLVRFLPELVLCGTIIVMLVLRVSDTTRRFLPSSLIALVGAITALIAIAAQLGLDVPPQREEIFTGMLVYDVFTIYFRTLLVFVTVLFILLTQISRLADEENSPDLYTLVLGAVLGMCLMASANHLLVVFLAVEMASVPSYALAGILKGDRKSSEASVKYAVYGAGAAGVMLYGTSLIAGITGSAHLPTIAWRLSQEAGADYQLPLVLAYQLPLVLAGLMLMVGVAFKLSAVPFHFWCPDVFEGASAEVNAFLSVASKAAALALLVRLAIGFAAPPESEPIPGVRTVNVQTHASRQAAEDVAAIQEMVPRFRMISAEPSTSAGESATATPSDSIREFIAYLVAIFAAVTCTFGNLAAYGQTNIKRLLAYSTIAHAGYMMMPVAAGMMLMNTNPDAAAKAFASLLVYAAIYVFMNFGAFAIVAFLRNAMGSEEIADYAGLVKSNPLIVICFSVILFSLLGLPPLAGFLAKLVIFAGLADAQMYWLLIVAGINTVISLFYYLKVVRVMTFDPEPDSRPPVAFPVIPAAYVVLVTAPIVLLILQWEFLQQWAVAACKTVVGL